MEPQQILLVDLVVEDHFIQVDLLDQVVLLVEIQHHLLCRQTEMQLTLLIADGDMLVVMERIVLIEVLAVVVLVVLVLMEIQVVLMVEQV